MARMPRASRSRGDFRLVLLAILLASCSWGRPAHAADGAWVYENAGAPAGRVGHVWLYDPVRDRGVAALGWNYPILRDSWWFTLRGTNDWSGLFAAGDPYRTYPAFVYDPIRDRVVIFGGNHELYWGRRIVMRVLPLLDPLDLAGLDPGSALPPEGSSAERAAVHRLTAALAERVGPAVER